MSQDRSAYSQARSGASTALPARILVAYASEFGATSTIAAVIGEVLRAGGSTVDVRTIVDVGNLSGYNAVVLGSAIYNGEWLPEAVHFVHFHEPALRRIPVAFFAVSMTMREDTPEHRRIVLEYLEPVRTAAPHLEPVSIGLFAGRMDYHKLPLLERLRFWLRARLPAGDYRDWAAIRAWAAEVRPMLVPDER